MPAVWGVERYRQWLARESREPELDGRRHWILDHLPKLRGKDLACWCEDWDGTGVPPGVCHAEVLLQLANPGITWQLSLTDSK